MYNQHRLRLAYIVSHPIQYQAPLLRRVAQEPDIDLTVFFCSDQGAREYVDRQFGGVRVKWDVPLLEGYRFQFLPGVNCFSLDFFSPINVGIYGSLKRGGFDAVWLHGYWNFTTLAAMVAAKVLGIPVLQRAEGTLIDRPRSLTKRGFKKLLLRNLRHLCRAVLPISSRNYEYWRYYLGPEFAMFSTPYAVDNRFFQERCAAAHGERESFRRELGLERGRPVILYASKLMRRKRCGDLIDAFLGMQTMAGAPRPYLLVVGEGSERSQCEARVRAAGSQDVRFLGFRNQSELPPFYDLCDLFVLPSVYEPFALVVNEVMNAGKAMVVSNEVGCQPDLVADGVNGRVFRARDVQSLRGVLESMIADPEALHEMGRRSLERINQWSFEEDVRGLRQALHHVAGLPEEPVSTSELELACARV